MGKVNGFGQGGCYDCCECGRKTRSTGDNGNVEMCPECYERCNIENEISDCGETPERLAEVEALKQAAIKKGGKFAATTETVVTVEPVADPAPESPILKALEMCRQGYQLAFEDARVKFIKNANYCPSQAVQWGESVVRAEYELGLVVRCHAKMTSCEGSVEVLDEIIAELTDDLISNVGNGESTSLLSRGVFLAQQMGLKNVIKMLRAVRQSAK